MHTLQAQFFENLQMAMKALSSKAFVGQEAKLRTRQAGAVASRLPVVVRAQAEEPVSCCTYCDARAGAVKQCSRTHSLLERLSSGWAFCEVLQPDSAPGSALVLLAAGRRSPCGPGPAGGCRGADRQRPALRGCLWRGSPRLRWQAYQHLW